MASTWDVPSAAQAPAAIGWYHRNATSPVARTLKQQGLEGLPGSFDPLLGQFANHTLTLLEADRRQLPVIHGRICGVFRGRRHFLTEPCLGRHLLKMQVLGGR